MRFCRFFSDQTTHGDNRLTADASRLGVVRDGAIHDVTAVLEALPALRWPFPREDQVIANFATLRPRMEELADKSPAIPLANVRLLSPVANPNKILLGVANYPEHVAATRKQPREHGMFIKATSALVGASEGVELRDLQRLTVHETELAIIIGKQGTNIPKARAFDYLLGYSIGMDITMRGDETPSYNKSFDTHGVLGPWVVTREEIAQPNNLDIRLWLNGELRQDETTSRMVLDVPSMIEFASSGMTLYPGDIFMTGNPKGASRIAPGDMMLAEIESIGRMEVAVRAEKKP